jgi:hypothetical protein
MISPVSGVLSTVNSKESVTPLTFTVWTPAGSPFPQRR